MMADVDDIIHYINSLKKGFDKDLFQSKIDELAYIVENEGLEYDDFHTLFKVWLNLTIPIARWLRLGACLVPKEKVENRTIDYSLRWLLSKCDDQTNFSKMGFLLDWLTAAMDCQAIDIKSLDYGYELFYSLLTYETLIPHAMKLVYNLTKPSDVTRRRVVELLDHAKNREANKNLYRQLQVLLGLFKSYKPECVPEDVPSISIHTSFRKINATLLNRFKISKSKRNTPFDGEQHLLWTNPVNSKPGRNKRGDSLVPNMEFVNIGSKQYAEQASQKTYFDFSDPVSLLQHSLRHVMSRPTKLRSLLCNETGLTLLAISSEFDQISFSHDLYHLLTNCFNDISQYSTVEKQYLLHRLAVLQQTVNQGIPVVTRFLAQFLPFWNESDFFAEIMDLIEWLSADCPEYIISIMDSIMKIYYRARPMEQCAIIKSLSTMYANLAYSSTRTRRHFLHINSSQTDYTQILCSVATRLTDMYNKGLQINPDDMCVLFSTSTAALRCARAELRHGQSVGRVPRPLSLAVPLLTTSGAVLENVATLILAYRSIFSKIKKKRPISSYESEQLKVLKYYTNDIKSCMFDENFLSNRKNGYVFSKLHPQMVSMLIDRIPDVEATLSLRNNLAFALFSYLESRREVTDKDYVWWFNASIGQEYPRFGKLLRMIVQELSPSAEV